MKLSQIDHVPDLYFVENILPDDLVASIALEDLWQYDWEDQHMQQGWKRRKLLPKTDSPLAQIDTHYNNVLEIIEHTLGISFEHKLCWSSFWMDYNGFSCDIHEDGAERQYHPLLAMQIYLTDQPLDLGTVFYHDKHGQKVRYRFPYKLNTGYLMLNHAGQWHGMTNTIPADHVRLSSYTYFGKFSHK